MRKLDRGPETLGDKLRALRRGQAVTLDMIERMTHIQKRHIEALERGRFDELPEPVYTRNLIRAYARALEADEKYFLELYDEEVRACDLIEPLATPRIRLKKKFLRVWHNSIALGAGIFFFLIIASYIVFQIIQLNKPPVLQLTYPESDISVDNGSIRFEGESEQGAIVEINGETVELNERAQFSEEIPLMAGLNEVEITARNRYSRSRSVLRHVFFEP